MLRMSTSNTSDLQSLFEFCDALILPCKMQRSSAIAISRPEERPTLEPASTGRYSAACWKADLKKQ